MRGNLEIGVQAALELGIAATLELGIARKIGVYWKISFCTIGTHIRDDGATPPSN